MLLPKFFFFTVFLLCVDCRVKRKKSRSDDAILLNSNNPNIPTKYLVEHSLSLPGEQDLWTERSTLHIDLQSRSGDILMHEWNEDEIEKYGKLSNVNGFYKLRITSLNNQSSNQISLIGSVRTCQLESSKEENILLHSDSLGNVNSFDYFTSNSHCKSTSKKFKNIPKSLTRKVTVNLIFGEKGTKPFAPDYEINPPVVNNQPWYKRYWWIILIFGGMMMMNVMAGAK